MSNRVLLFTGLIFKGASWNNLNAVLKEYFGDYMDVTPVIPFDYTDYYEKEMGSGLKRRWAVFDKVINAEDIRDIKIKTCDLEKEYAVDYKRVFNIDPGYVSYANVVLVTTKDYAHRIYLGKGIYGEVTLIYKRGKGYCPLDWTYPDYKQPETLAFFNKARAYLKEMLKE